MGSGKKSEIDLEAQVLLRNLNNHDDYDSDYDTDDDIETKQHDGYAKIYIWKTSAKGHLKRIGHVSMTLCDVNHQELAHISAWPDLVTNTIQYLRDYAADLNNEYCKPDQQFIFKELNTKKMLAYFNEVKEKLTWRVQGSGFWRHDNATINCVGIVLQLLYIGNNRNLFDFEINTKTGKRQGVEEIESYEEYRSFTQFATRGFEVTKDEWDYEKAKDIWRIGKVGFNQHNDKYRFYAANSFLFAGCLVCSLTWGLCAGLLFYGAIVGEENVHGFWRKLITLWDMDISKKNKQILAWIYAVLFLAVTLYAGHHLMKKIIRKTVAVTPNDINFLLEYISTKGTNRVQLLDETASNDEIDMSSVEEETQVNQNGNNRSRFITL